MTVSFTSAYTFKRSISLLRSNCDLTERFAGVQMKCSYKLIGYLVLAFGCGVVLTYLLPIKILVIIETILIIAAGILWLFG